MLVLDNRDQAPSHVRRFLIVSSGRSERPAPPRRAVHRRGGRPGSDRRDGARAIRFAPRFSSSSRRRYAFAIATSASACCALQPLPASSGSDANSMPAATSPAATALASAFAMTFTVLDGQLDEDRDVPRAGLRLTVSERRSHARRADVRRLGRDVADLPAALVDLLRGRVERVREQEILVRRIRGTRHCSYLRIREPPIRERGGDHRQPAQRVRAAQLLACRRQRHPAAPREPLGAAPQAHFVNP